LQNGAARASKEGARLDSKALFYFGNAAVDQVLNTGWFVGQFVAGKKDCGIRPTLS
jgi:hypothetical protein